jgi:hypothetical protein
MRTLAVLVLVFAGFVATPADAREFVAQASDFTCISDWAKVRHTRVFNKNKRLLKKAIRILERDKPNKHFPVGTILQLWPGEASVKRGGQYDPENDGWEFFSLKTSASGTTIADRGITTRNFQNLECQPCHVAAKKFDFVCEHGHGCGELGLPDSVFDALQAGDSRCQPAH